MKTQSAEKKNYKYTDYIFEKTTVRYVNVENKVFMLLIPNEKISEINDDYFTKKTDDGGFPNHMDWFAGSLVHLHLSHCAVSPYENSLKFGECTRNLNFLSQEVFEDEASQTIKTYLTSDGGYSVCHILTHFDGENGFEIKTVFTNNSPQNVCLELLTSASLDGLSPFMTDDGSDSLKLHSFKSGWAIEGKHICRTLPEMNLEKSWGGSFDCEKISNIGSKTTSKNFPYVALEDSKAGCIWGVKIKHNSSWQIEFSRYGTPLSLSCAIADFKSGMWRKTIKSGESFESPVAYVAVSMGGIDEISNDLLEMSHRDVDAYGEEGMPLIFNDWVTHWGDSSEEKLISLAEKLKGSKVKYFVADDGWQTAGGDWDVDMKKFPRGFRHYADKIRELGMIPGIWMEYEAVKNKAKHYSEKYDRMMLKKDGEVLKIADVAGSTTKFYDLRNEEVQEFLDEKVIRFFKDNGIGYLKIDYNSIVSAVDDDDSYGEGLRKQMNAARDFVVKLKREVPDIIIENCSSGGARLDPMNMSITAMSSFSDAHECMEVPAVAANMHYLIPPRQSQIWCVLKSNFSDDHLHYVIASGFLGRLCWSGEIDKLSDKQLAMMPEAEEMYSPVSHIIKHGRSKIYRTKPLNFRKLCGSQAVLRYSPDRNEILAVCHFFDNAEKMKINLGGDYEIVSSLYNECCTIKDDTLSVCGRDRCAAVLYLKRK